jgi:hypothetical protein
MKHFRTYRRKNKKTRKTRKIRRHRYGGAHNNNNQSVNSYNSNNSQMSFAINENKKYEELRDDLINVLSDIYTKFEEIISSNPNFELYENQFINFIESFNEKAIEIDEKLGNNDMQEIIQERVEDIRNLFVQYANNNATVVNN